MTHQGPAPEKLKVFSIRLTDSEKATLRERAGAEPLGPFIRGLVLGDAAAPRLRARQYRAVQDADALATVLAALGNSHLASNVNQLAKAVNTGTLPVTRETEESIRHALRDIYLMRELLLSALGIKKQDLRASVSAAFAATAEFRR